LAKKPKYALSVDGKSHRSHFFSAVFIKAKSQRSNATTLKIGDKKVVSADQMCLLPQKRKLVKNARAIWAKCHGSLKINWT